MVKFVYNSLNFQPIPVALRLAVKFRRAQNLSLYKAGRGEEGYGGFT